MLFPANIGPIIISIFPLNIGLNVLQMAIFSSMVAVCWFNASSKEDIDDYFDKVRVVWLPRFVAAWGVVFAIV